MNHSRMNAIEEEVITFLQKSRSKFTETNTALSGGIEDTLLEDDTNDNKRYIKKEEEIEQTILNSIGIVPPQYNCLQSHPPISHKQMKNNIWEFKVMDNNSSNFPLSPSSGDFINNFNGNHTTLQYNKNDVNNLYMSVNTENFPLKNTIKYENISNKNESSGTYKLKELNIENYENDEFKEIQLREGLTSCAEFCENVLDFQQIKKEKFKSDRFFKKKSILRENNSNNWTIEKTAEKKISLEKTKHRFQDVKWSEENKENFPTNYDIERQNIIDFSNESSVANSIKDDDDKDTSCSIHMNNSVGEGDCLEEIIIKEKINRLNNSESEEDNFCDVANSIIYDEPCTIMQDRNLKKELLFYSALLSEAIECNIVMRNYLYDLEHILLRLVEGSVVTTETGIVKIPKRITSCYKKKRFYHSVLSPYFKDKRGISWAHYVEENITSDGGDASAKDYLKLYQFSNQPQIYDVYMAIKQYFEVKYRHQREYNASNGKQTKKVTRRGRKKTNYVSENSESDLYSMESQFISFLQAFKSMGSTQIMFDDEINWNEVASAPCVQGLTAAECETTWMLVLKPLLQLGVWNGKESTQVSQIAKHYNYQNWNKIAEELGTGRTGYLCFCHVMSKSLLGVNQNTGPWTKEEDDYLLRLIEQCSYGNTIMWGRIFYYFEDRTVTQVLNRWYRLNPALKRGKFNHREDIMLMYCVEQFGRDFGKIATLFGNRSPIQLRERFFAIKDLTDETKLGEWSVEEDKLLLNLVKEHGESKWAEIAAEFPGRNRTQIRHRYTSVLKRWLAKPTFQLESLKRHKRTTHVKSVNRVRQIDTSEIKVRKLVENKLKTGKATLKRSKRAGKQPTDQEENGLI